MSDYFILFLFFWLCWVFVSVRGLSLVAASGGHSSSRCTGLSLSQPLLLRSTGSRCAGSVVVAHGPSCSAACGVFPDQGSNPCPLHWQADSQPLRHQGSPSYLFCKHFGGRRRSRIGRPGVRSGWRKQHSESSKEEHCVPKARCVLVRPVSLDTFSHALGSLRASGTSPQTGSACSAPHWPQESLLNFLLQLSHSRGSGLPTASSFEVRRLLRLSGTPRPSHLPAKGPPTCQVSKSSVVSHGLFGAGKHF